MNNGHMEESISGTATLCDVEVDVFVAFCEFAYQRSYTAPSRDGQNQDKRNDTTGESGSGGKKSASKSTAADLRCENKVVEYKWGAPKKKKANDEYHDNGGHSKDQMPYGTKLKNAFRNLQLTKKVNACTGPGAVALHAKVYEFATMYLIKSLRDISLGYLHSELCDFRLGTDHIQEIFDLVEHTYSHTERSEAWGPELRDLVAHYVAIKAHDLGKYDQMAHLLDNYGEAGSDVLQLLIRDA
jgi:hypothetical protein